MNGAKQPRIAVNMAFRNLAERFCHVTQDYYIEAVRNAGGLGICIPEIDFSETELSEYLELADGFLFIGGMDYPPELYGEKAQPETACTRLRADSDLRLIRGALRTGKPLLGICGGCQLLSIALGGKLIQHLPNANRHLGGVRHRASLTLPGRFSECMKFRVGAEFEVNSFHHQGVDPNRPGDGAVVAASAFDGSVEVLELPAARFAVATQFHPERMAEFAPLFAAFVAATKGSVREPRRSPSAP